MLSNSQVLSDREKIFGTLHGVDFGSNVSVLVRSPSAMVLWLGGHTWSINGNSRYSASTLALITDRNETHWWRNYKTFEVGGKLTTDKLIMHKEAIVKMFGQEHWDAILDATKNWKTLIIEGGGEQPRPRRYRGI